MPVPDEKEEQKAFVTRCKSENILIISIENSLQFPVNAVLDIVRPFLASGQLTQIKTKLNKLMSMLTSKRYTQGMLKGCPDLFLPDFKLFIEMKRREGGITSLEQLQCHSELRKRGYKVEVCKGAGEAWGVVEREKA